MAGYEKKKIILLRIQYLIQTQFLECPVLGTPGPFGGHEES